ncbi:MAG: cation-transporting P-type ATPase, partial [Candidatus Nomurabacteria bacterium]|nr:cation-transporting P-type ATPase [Candidatus Nomurabacteria bacterium]
DETLRHLKVNGAHGLSESEVFKRQKKYGKNVLNVKTEPLWRKILEPFLDLFMAILIGACMLSLIQKDFLDALIIAIIITINATIFYVQRFSTEKIIRSLRQNTVQKITVLRSGKDTLISAEDLVAGDILLLSEGEKVPADCRVLEAKGVKVDESILTGESTHVSKHHRKLSGNLEVYDQENMLFSGTFLISGSAKAVVARIGNQTEFGQIANLASESTHLSPVQQKINKLIKKVAIAVGILAVIVFTLELFRGIDVANSLKFVMAMTVSAVPEDLPIAISIVLALGMRRMAKKKALVTNMRAIETVGAITTIATDKTGTLTENKLAVIETWCLSHDKNLVNKLLRFAAVTGEKVMDPLDNAMNEFADTKLGAGVTGQPAHSFLFDQKLAMSGNLWHDGEKYRLVIKGAPEKIMERAHLSKATHKKCMTELHRLTSKGLRVIAVAQAAATHNTGSLAKIVDDTKLVFVGFMAVADRLRKESKGAISAAKHAGVSVRMITGDHFETAYAIGKELGLVKDRSEAMDCRQIEMLDDEELKTAVQDIYVFSRVTPEQKFRLLSVLEQTNITAMTGDGINDVPALTNAHVGVAMGTSTQIVKDAGDIILLDDNFKNIVEAMREGRVIVANIKRMLMYLLSTNAGEALTMVGALVLGMPLPLVPVQILWVNLVTDSLMVIPLGLEKAENNVMKHKPKPFDAPLLSRSMTMRMILMAVTMAAIVLVVFWYYQQFFTFGVASTLAFMALVVAQWANALNMRSNFQSIFARLRTINPMLTVSLIIAIGLQLILLFTPLGQVMHVVSVPMDALIMVCVMAFIIPIVVVECHKYAISYLSKK